jgi:hypothetical protein
MWSKARPYCIMIAPNHATPAESSFAKPPDAHPHCGQLKSASRPNYGVALSKTGFSTVALWRRAAQRRDGERTNA